MPKTTLNGVSINYRIDGEGYPLVFIHGATFELSTWHPQVSLLQTQYRTITYDIRGHGKSEIPEFEYSIEDCVEDLYQLLVHLHVDRTYLVGISMGGNIALNFTLSHSEMVKALILVGTNPGAVLKETREMARDAMKTVDSAGFELLMPTHRAKLFSKIFIEMHPEHIGQWERRFLSNTSEGFKKVGEANLTRPDLTGRLRDIHAPTLIIIGEEDTVTPMNVAETMHAEIPNSRLAVIPDCGHISNEEQPDTFNSIVWEYLERVEASNTGRKP